MSWVDPIGLAVARVGLGRLLPARGPLIVMYHGIGGEDGVAPADFGDQLDALTALRDVVPLREALGALGRPEAVRLASITFDDGYRDFAQLALPALAARGLHATLFVPAGRMGGYNAWDEGAHARRGILTATELRDLDPCRVEIGAHGYTHCRMAGLDDGALAHETDVARRDLAEAIDRPIDLFAYPYGQGDDFDARAEQAVRRAGYAAACSTRFGRGSSPDDRYGLRRVGIEPRDSLRHVRAKLEGGYDFVAVKEALGVRWRAARSGP